MTSELPEPASRKEEYLAKAAGMDISELPEPASREEEYLNAIANNGGGGGGTTYTAGEGIDITDNTISVDTDTVQEKLTAGEGIDITDNTISTTGGGGPTVVQTIGTSTTDVMSQKAVTSMMYADPSDGTQVQIGKNTRTQGIGSSAIGIYTTVSGHWSVALGNGTTASGLSSVAIGAGANATQQGQFDISNNTGGGYNSSNYRLVTGVYDGQNAHDAVTVGQVNSVIDAINAALSTNISHIGA